jgi:hypothetical protein
MGFEADWAVDENDNYGLPRARFRESQVVWVGIYRSVHPDHPGGVSETVRVFSNKSKANEWVKLHGPLENYETIYIEKIEVW